MKTVFHDQGQSFKRQLSMFILLPVLVMDPMNFSRLVKLSNKQPLPVNYYISPVYNNNDDFMYGNERVDKTKNYTKQVFIGVIN